MRLAPQRSIGRLVGIMLIIVVAGVLLARSYYGSRNRSVDPRIRQARELYEHYDMLAQAGNFHEIVLLLDSIATFYQSTPHYAASYELGVLYNNRAAAMLTIALYWDSIPESANPYRDLSTDSLLVLAENQIHRTITLYEQWNGRFEGKEEKEIKEMIRVEFMNGLDPGMADQNEKYLSNRVREISASLVENQRRLSVCHTNLGLLYRIRQEYPGAVAQYERAIELWDRNLDAENNLNKLLGRPLKKRNIIQQLFPPGREINNK